MSLSPPDYIVIGAGSSGCVVVNRLSADPSVQVLLIEAGGGGAMDAAVTTPGRWVSLLGSSRDWSYVTQPEPGLDHRVLAFPRGKALGGSSAINAMVHIRGDRRCFDGWVADGNAGWGYDDLLPLFVRSERSERPGAAHRGVEGPLAVSRCRDSHASHHAFLDAAFRLGFRADADHDFNQAEPDGCAGFVEKNILEGRRHSTADAFLAPALARANVRLEAGACATRLLVERGRVVGVEYLCDGRLERVRALREVVLCAGAVDSPRLLMLSGIGPADDLRRHGIEIALDLPGVGRNLQDHLKLPVRWRGSTRLPGSTVTAGLFTSSRPGLPYPDLQFYVGRGLEQPDDFVTITVSLVRVQSRGRITLSSSDPLAPPIIQANHLQEEADVDALVHGLRLARAFGASAAYDGLRDEELEPGGGATSDEELTRYARQKADTIYHAAGTCRMGPAADRDAVVDPDLRVRGVDGLRVADASIMPVVVNAPTHAVCVAIGEKCAALVAQQ